MDVLSQWVAVRNIIGMFWCFAANAGFIRRSELKQDGFGFSANTLVGQGLGGAGAISAPSGKLLQSRFPASREIWSGEASQVVWCTLPVFLGQVDWGKPATVQCQKR